MERAPDGVSTCVYRVRHGAATVYLRIFADTQGSFAPEVHVHELLRQRGVRVPEVLHFESCHDLLGRSVMLTSAIEGSPIAKRPAVEVQDALVAAGRDLALVNTIAVDGFGWVERKGAAEMALKAPLSCHRAFMLEGLDPHLETLARTMREIDVDAMLCGIQRYDRWLEVPRACLAHGDFLARHIFAHDNRYTGIIDFSAIRGAGPLYDLAYFAMHDTGASLLPPVLDGYRQVAELPSDLPERLTFLRLLIAIGPLARHAAGKAPNKRDHPAYGAIMAGLRMLLGDGETLIAANGERPT